MVEVALKDGALVTIDQALGAIVGIYSAGIFGSNRPMLLGWMLYEQTSALATAVQKMQLARWLTGGSA
jgi:hypothetical protein